MFVLHNNNINNNKNYTNNDKILMAPNKLFRIKRVRYLSIILLLILFKHIFNFIRNITNQCLDINCYIGSCGV